MGNRASRHQAISGPCCLRLTVSCLVLQLGWAYMSSNQSTQWRVELLLLLVGKYVTSSNSIMKHHHHHDIDVTSHCILRDHQKVAVHHALFSTQACLEVALTCGDSLVETTEQHSSGMPHGSKLVCTHHTAMQVTVTMQ